MQIKHAAVSEAPAKPGKISGPEWNADHVIIGEPGAGASAYEVAVANGFVGNEAAWLASLVGPSGAPGLDSTVPGPQGNPGNDGVTPVKGVDYFDGADGIDGVSPVVAFGAGEDADRLTVDGVATGPHLTGSAGVGWVTFPVGYILISSVNTNPSTFIGYGTWENVGAGRVLVGLNGADPDFDVVGETGGAKTHTHANHTFTQPGDHTMGAIAATGSTAVKVGTSGANAAAQAHTHAAPTITAHSGGAVDAHDSPNHMPPYLVVYFWERTA